jgi:hypothetical protein
MPPLRKYSAARSSGNASLIPQLLKYLSIGFLAFPTWVMSQLLTGLLLNQLMCCVVAIPVSRSPQRVGARGRKMCVMFGLTLLRHCLSCVLQWQSLRTFAGT